MFEDYKKLRPFISEFTFGIKLQYKDFDKKEVVGVLVSSSSLIRKGSTMKRVRKLIRDMELDLKVDEYNDRLSFFRIIKKNNNSELPTHARGDGLGFGSHHSY